MSQHPLIAITALDGRYRSKVEPLAAIASEFGLIRLRVKIECEWFTALAKSTAIAELAPLNDKQLHAVAAIHSEFTLADAERVKSFETTTNHDVKAVEYFVKEKISDIDGLPGFTEFVHFACTSEDINNLAYALLLKQARDEVMVPVMRELVATITGLAQENAGLAMLSRTHGQPASPTTLGKELRNVSERLQRQLSQFEVLAALGKMNGAVGNFNAHIVAYPLVDWPSLTSDFVQNLGLTHNAFTTQIEPHDYVAEWFHTLSRFNQILLDFDRDVWSYISIQYFKQRKVEGETSSSTMPHKVNPIDFENSEGNLGIANALLGHMADKLQVSRWQRDLSDSTVLRNIGSAFGHCLVAYHATLKGLSRLEVNPEAIERDLDGSWEVLSEAVQTVMRKYGLPEPYEQLKKLTRGEQMDEVLFKAVLAQLDIPAVAKRELAALTPATYVGLARELTEGGV
jgi:adenylosuccinate lyase